MIQPGTEMAQLLAEDKRYRFEAYLFVFEALTYANTVLGLGAEAESEPLDDEFETEGSFDESGPQSHVTGQQLCEAIRSYAHEQYGYMSKAVLNSWGVYSTGDFGEIVFNLIRIGRMRKTPHDRRCDFDDVYDFETGLQQDYKIDLSE